MPGTGTGVCVGQNSPTLTGTVTLPDGSTLTPSAINAGTNIEMPVVSLPGGTSPPTAGAILGTNNGSANEFYFYNALRADLFLGFRTTQPFPNPINDTGTDGFFLTGIGLHALSNISTGSEVVGVGAGTGQWLQTGIGDTAIGDNALGGIDTGSTTANGSISYTWTGGYYSGPNLGGGAAWDSFTGPYSGYGATTGGENVFNGPGAGYSVTTGSYNIDIGYDYPVNCITTGSSNIRIGNQVCAGMTGSTANMLNIGNEIFATSLASGTSVSGGNVGIDNDNPQYNLDVAGTFNVSGSAKLGSSLAVTNLATVGSLELTNSSETCSTAINGFIYSGSNTWGACSNGVERWLTTGGGNWQSATASGIKLLTGSVGGTAPNIIPNQSALSAGLGASAAGNATLFASNGTGGSAVNVLTAVYNGVTISQPLTLNSTLTAGSLPAASSGSKAICINGSTITVSSTNTCPM